MSLLLRRAPRLPCTAATANRGSWRMRHAAAVGPGRVAVTAPATRRGAAAARRREANQPSAGFLLAPLLSTTCPCEWPKAHAFLVANGSAGARTGETSVNSFVLVPSYAQCPTTPPQRRRDQFFLQFVPWLSCFARSKAQKLAARQTSDAGRRVSRRRPLRGGLWTFLA